MIDIENIIYTDVAERLNAAFPGISISGIEDRTPPSFPHVTVVEASNTTRSDTVSSFGRENHVNLMYEVNVYSNSVSDRKTEAKKIFQLIDSYFLSHGFLRTSENGISSDSASLYRIIARYTGCAGKNNVIYRR